MGEKIQVAIDGPAGSGKSTTAKLAAEKLQDFIYVDTGAMYRAFTYFVMENNALGKTDEISELLKEFNVNLTPEGKVIINNSKDVTKEIRTPEVDSNVSKVASIKEVRLKMKDLQKEIAQDNNVVMEGRDIGTAVLPNAQIKVFLLADIQTRAERRQAQLAESGISTNIIDLVEEIKKRDEADSTRANNPLRKADDAVELDTSKLSINEQVSIIVKMVNDYKEN